ncbi:MAG: UDP-N-acetylmuramoyl-L-alanine--D-glutamate ligase [Bacteroidetes bacterium]|nr:UDP-N-acetylmuramoyl-L-alanine--D-glutamate ligase [Bacteroidota bacterium]
MKSYDIVILGAGESGTGTAVLAKKKGLSAFVSDAGKIRDEYKNVLLHLDIPFEEEKHSFPLILSGGEIMKSPGIPDTAPVIREAARMSIPVISELEFAARYTQAKLVCITGSNGKTTTTLLTHHICRNAGLNAGLAGNVGNSFAMMVAEKDYDLYILEVSSFQLDGMFRFKADIAVLLNITPDHLDRYRYDFGLYADAKFRITQNQGPMEALIYCADDETIQQGLQKRDVRSKMYPFSIQDKLNSEGAWMENNQIIINVQSKPFNMTMEMLALQGKHNIYNSMASAIAGRLLEIRKDNIKASLADFQNVEHRLEFVANIMGIEFINDSKATNINSSWYALESMQRKVIWIAGGQDKGNDYSYLLDLVRQKVKAIICLGVDNTKIYNAFSSLPITIVETRSMEEAVRYALYLGEKGDITLLSPACASFDLFENYIDRGNQFKAAVRQL